MRYSPAFYDAGKLQRACYQRACDEKASANNLTQCVRAWIDLERLKREIRGIPPLSPAKLTELFDHMKRTKRSREIGNGFIEVEN
jgi:hypothetical protein